jgi:hypothetical protein
MTHFFGLPAWYITVAPADLHSSMIVRLSQSLDLGPDDVRGEHIRPVVEFRLPSFPERVKLVVENPVAAAEYHG